MAGHVVVNPPDAVKDAPHERRRFPRVGQDQNQTRHNNNGSYDFEGPHGIHYLSGSPGPQLFGCRQG